MAIHLRWLGHNCWLIETAGRRLILDPFLDESPVAPLKSEEVDVDYVLISHGHFDHMADAAKIAKANGAVVIATYEICEWLQRKGVTSRHAMNVGGTFSFPFGRVKVTPAIHTSMLPDGSYGGSPVGFLLLFDGGNIYFACDTGLFLDMQLIGDYGLALAVLPIGDNFTMGPEDALRAVKLLRPKRVVPVHMNTWPLIAQDAEAWAAQVRQETDSEPVVLNPGDTIVLP
ncbi:MAG: metal-dependent hydrolase [Thermogutta sp.]